MEKTYKEYLKEAGNVHLAYYLEAADTLNINYEVITKSLMAKFSKGDKHWYIINTATPLTNTTSTTIAKRKSLTNQVLESFNIPVPKQVPLHTKEDAIKFFEQYKNIVIKPTQQLGGIGITLLPETKREVTKAYKIAFAKSKAKGDVKVLGEEFLEGENYRFLVAGDNVVGMVRRKAAHVVGDGEHNIKELIDISNKKRKEKLLKPIIIDNEVKLRLKHLNINLKYKPQKNEEILLRYSCNLTVGGTTEECSQEVDPYYKELAIEAVKAIGTRFGGVDIITPDISKPTKCGINEINYNPGLRVHYMVDKGEAVKVAVPIMEEILKTA